MLARNRKFADSPVEGNGFEPSVPGREATGDRPSPCCGVRRRTWYLAFGTRKGWAQMPYADYDEWARSSPARFPGSKKAATARPVLISSCVGSRAVPVWLAVSLRSGEKTIHRVLRPTEAPPLMRGYSRADLPYEQPTKTDPDGECGSCWQDDIIINHFHYEPCHPHKERRHNDP